MSPLLVLPAPLPSSSITLGQLITDPLCIDAPSLKPAQAPVHTQSTAQSKYQDTITHDDHGRFTSTRFISRLSGQAHYSHENLLLLAAEQMSHTTIDRPATAFSDLRGNSTTHSFLRKMACEKTPVYFVTGIQTLKKPSFKSAVVEHGVITEAAAPSFPMPVRRVDSALQVTSSPQHTTEADDSILAVQLLKVKCRVGAKSEPHCVEDLDYRWSYHSLDDDLQLSIGLGKPLQQDGLRMLAGMHSEGSCSSSTYSSSDDGMLLG